MDAFDILCSMVIEDGRTWGEAATDVQLADGDAITNHPEVPYHFITRARSYSKSADLAAIVLACALTAPSGARLFWCAADADQGVDIALDSIRGYIDRTPILRGQVDLQARKVVIPATGTTIEVVPADAASALGTRPYMLVVDELANWHEGDSAKNLWYAVKSAMIKFKDSRLVVITTPSDPRHFSYEILENARKSDLWRIAETYGPPPWVSQEKIEEQRLSLPASKFTQLMEGRWIETEGAFLSVENIDQCFTLDGPNFVPEPGRHYFGAMDLGVVNDRTVFAIAHLDDRGQIVLDQKKVWVPTKDRQVSLPEVEAYVLDAYSTFNFHLTVDPWQGYQMIERLRASGVPITVLNFGGATKQHLASALLEAFGTKQFALYESDGFRDELRALRVKPLSNGRGFTFDHQSGKGQHDDQAMVLAMLALHATESDRGVLVQEDWIGGDSEEFVYTSGEIRLVGEQYRDLDTHPLEDSWL